MSSVLVVELKHEAREIWTGKEDRVKSRSESMKKALEGLPAG